MIIGTDFLIECHTGRLIKSAAAVNLVIHFSSWMVPEKNGMKMPIRPDRSFLKARGVPNG